MYKALKNGKIIEIQDALIPVTSVEVLYGFGVYESIRVVAGKAFFADDHFLRLLSSARIIGIQHQLNIDLLNMYLQKILDELDRIRSFNIKIVLYGGANPEDFQIFFIPTNPLFVPKKDYKRGVSVIIEKYERMFPQAKTLNMLGSYLLYKKAKQFESYDCLLLNNKDEILEGTRTNFFAIRGNTVFSSPDNKILPGVTRTHLLAALKGRFNVEYKSIKKEDIHAYDAFFLTSTSSKVLPVSSINNETIKLPSCVFEVVRIFDEYLKVKYPS